MARIAGVDLPGRKHVLIGLQYIYGVGQTSAAQICEKTGIAPTKRIDDLDDNELKKIRDVLEGQYKVEGDLRRDLAISIKRLMDQITDLTGNVIAWSSAGSRGFKGSRKSTPFAAQLAAEDAARKAQEHGMSTVAIFVKGPGAGRESALRAFQTAGMRVTLIRD